MAKAPIQLPNPAQGYITFAQLDKDTRDRFIRNEVIVYTILVVVALTLVSTLIGVAAIVLDQLHFNNQIYRDGYSTPTQTKVVTRTITKDVFIKSPQN